VYPDWVTKTLQNSIKTLREVQRKRGKNLKVYPGLDMKGI